VGQRKEAICGEGYQTRDIFAGMVLPAWELDCILIVSFFVFFFALRIKHD
jgi:hypothetical protein